MSVVGSQQAVAPRLGPLRLEGPMTVEQNTSGGLPKQVTAFASSALACLIARNVRRDFAAVRAWRDLDRGRGTSLEPWRREVKFSDRYLSMPPLLSLLPSLRCKRPAPRPLVRLVGCQGSTRRALYGTVAVAVSRGVIEDGSHESPRRESPTPCRPSGRRLVTWSWTGESRLTAADLLAAESAGDERSADEEALRRETFLTKRERPDQRGHATQG